ncbi:MAG TPA: M20/M25/M40 family metallo-hydrolase [Candidatus Limnocylindrales bacterium]|nr:M20/M25/M40 family metallo-hydrolase [Candidatus Limnocylindrales bacterium]
MAQGRGLPSAAIDPAAWATAHAELVELLRELIRIPSVNPPEAPGDGELRAARLVADRLAAEGLRPEVVEPFPGRGSVATRLRGDGTGGGPLLLLSHLDVVPAPPEGWTHEPFGGDVADGYVWGRGAVDMKGMVAMEVAVILALAREARAAGRDPATDPIPGLRRDVLFAATADEEAGGHAGAGWIVEHRPDWLRADGALNECGGVSVTVGGRRLYPIGVAEKGYAVYRITVRGTWGHGSMPRPDNAAVRAAAIVTRLAEPWEPRVTPVMARFLRTAADATGGETATLLRGLAAGDPGADAALEKACDPSLARAGRALLRDTISTGIIAAGVKYNVIPGTAEVHIDCRTLPGTTEADLRAGILTRLGEDLAAACEIEPYLVAPAVEAPADGELYEIMAATLVDHDPEAVPAPAMAPFATDAKHTMKLGVPTYGFSPLRLDPDERFLERFHGTDERVSLEALRFGLPVLYDVVRRYGG